MSKTVTSSTPPTERRIETDDGRMIPLDRGILSDRALDTALRRGCDQETIDDYRSAVEKRSPDVDGWMSDLHHQIVAHFSEAEAVDAHCHSAWALDTLTYAEDADGMLAERWIAGVRDSETREQAENLADDIASEMRTYFPPEDGTEQAAWWTMGGQDQPGEADARELFCLLLTHGGWR